MAALTEKRPPLQHNVEEGHERYAMAYLRYMAGERRTPPEPAQYNLNTTRATVLNARVAELAYATSARVLGAAATGLRKSD